MFAADRAHFHHRLLAYGLNQYHVAIVAYIVTATIAGLGLFMIYTRGAHTLVVLVCLLLVLMLVFRLVGSVRLRETIDRLQYKYEIQRQVKEEVRGFEEVQLHFREAEDFSQWWNAVCLAGDRLGAEKMSLHLETGKNSYRDLSWNRTGKAVNGDNPHNTLQTSIPVKGTSNGPSSRLIVEINTRGSVEAAGRKLALLTRLMEETSINAMKYYG